MVELNRRTWDAEVQHRYTPRRRSKPGGVPAYGNQRLDWCAQCSRDNAKRGSSGSPRAWAGPRSIFGDAAPEVRRTFERLRDTAIRLLDDRATPMVVSYRIRVGVR